MRLHIASLLPQGKEAHALQRLAALSESAQHEVVDDPARAEIIIFTDLDPAHRFDTLRRHPLLRTRTQDCYTVYHWHEPYGVLPGIYTETPRIGSRLRYRAGLYWVNVGGNPHVRPDDPLPSVQRRYLFSFHGRNSHPVRGRIFQLPTHWQGLQSSVQNTDGYDHWAKQTPDSEEFERRYVETARESYFALCPRGLRRPSIRLFEMMQLGICPVVLADGYIFPEGPTWDTFCLQIPERNAPDLWRILAGREDEAVEKGRRAQQAWNQWFALEKQFDYIVDQLTQLRTNLRSAQSSRWVRQSPWVFAATDLLIWYDSRLNRMLRQFQRG